MAVRRVKNIVATTDAIAAYGGIRLTEEAAEQLALQLRAGVVPMTINHNADHVVAASNVDAYTERRDDGELNVWIEFDVAEAEWDAVMEEIHNRGATGGFSFTTFESIDGGSDAAIWVAADAHHYTSSDIRAMAASFARHQPTRSSLAYQFSFLPDAAVFVTFATSVLSDVPSDVLATMIVDACKSLVRPNRANIFNFAVRTSGKKVSARVRVVANDPEAFAAAVDQVPEALKAALASRPNAASDCEITLRDGNRSSTTG